MSAIPKKRRLSVEEYLAIESNAETKSEFFDGQIFAMAGASRIHNEVKENLCIELGSRLKGSTCRTYSSDQRVCVKRTGLRTYPDLIVVCGKPEMDDIDPNAILNPRVIIEILSPATADYDRGAKFGHYQQIPSLQEVLFVSPDRMQIEHYTRGQDDIWNLTTLDDPTAALTLASVSASVPIADIYRDVEISKPVDKPLKPNKTTEKPKSQRKKNSNT